MKRIIIKTSQFRLEAFLNALHKFCLEHLTNGNPLPVVSGDTVYHDAVDLAAEGEEEVEVPDDSLERLEAGLSLFAQFAAFNGFDGFDCADGQEVEVPDLDDEEEDEDDEPPVSRRRRTRKYLEAVAGTTADECTCYGFVLSLNGDKIEIEAKVLSDVTGECELVPLVEPNLLSDPMRRWANSFMVPKRGGKP